MSIHVGNKYLTILSADMKHGAREHVFITLINARDRDSRQFQSGYISRNERLQKYESLIYSVILILRVKYSRIAFTCQPGPIWGQSDSNLNELITYRIA